MSRLITIVWVLSLTAAAGAQDTDNAADGIPAAVREERADFQSQELITSRSLAWVFQPGEEPRIIWRDVERVRELGFTEPLRVRWFDGELNEADSPATSGRWAAIVEGTAPNGTVFRRGFTFYAIPPQPVVFSPTVTVDLPELPDTADGRVWREHQPEFQRVAKDLLGKAMLSDQRSAILLAGLAESRPLGRPARYVESTEVLNLNFHLALRRKLSGTENGDRTLHPPRKRDAPVPTLRVGTPAAAGVVADAAEQLDAVCRDWVNDTGDPFVTLVARRGVIVLHRAYGNGSDGQPVDLDYRCWVASITKTVTALMFARFVDQDLLSLDDQLDAAFADYPHVPTFRQCLNHTSGLTGRADFGGFANPYLDNVVLNGIDMNQPNSKYRYSGLGFELTAKAMELLTGQSAPKLYDQHLFQPLGFDDVVFSDASASGHFTARELGILAQLVVNRGSYGDQEFLSAETFEQLLPQPLTVPGEEDKSEGIGLHWRLRGVDGYSNHTVGHGSFSGCIFTIDLDRELIIVQIRARSGDRHGQWSRRLFETASRIVPAEDR